MKHYSTIFILTILISMVESKAYAYDIAVENADGITIYYDYINFDSELRVVCPEIGNPDYKYSGNVVIPEEVIYMDKTLKVTCLGSDAFFDNEELTSVTIPRTITTFGRNVFGGCSNLTSLTIECDVPRLLDLLPATSQLTSITLGENVTSIEDEAFCNCTNLSSIIIPNSVTRIGDRAFEGCYTLTNVTIPSSVTYIGKEILGACHALTSINVEEGNTVYDSRNNCNAIIKTDENKLIAGCKNTSIPENVTSIENAFAGCEELTSFTIPIGVTVIGEDAFVGCTALNSITIPTSVTVIGARAFAACYGLTSVTIPTGVTIIGEDAFSLCENLTSVTIPSSVQKIGSGAFSRCKKMSYLYVEAKEPIQSLDVTTFEDIDKTKCILYVPDGCVEKYRSADIWKDFVNIRTINEPEEPQPEQPQQEIVKDNIVYTIDGGHVTITQSDNASGELKIEASVVIDGKTYEVAVIAKEAFKASTSLTSVVIPNSITSIGEKAFEGCIGLHYIEIGTGIKEIANKAFANISKSNSRTRGSDDGLQVYCKANNVPATSSDVFEGTDISNATLHVPDGLIDVYKNVAPWNGFGTITGLSTGINAIVIDNPDTLIFDIQGNRLTNPRKGLNIIRTKDGKAKKIYLK